MLLSVSLLNLIEKLTIFLSIWFRNFVILEYTASEKGFTTTLDLHYHFRSPNHIFKPIQQNAVVEYVHLC